MKKNKIIIAIMILIVFIIITLIGLIIVLNDSKTIEENSIQNKSDFIIEEENLEEVKSRNEFFDVKQCIEQYFNFIKNEDKQALLDILDKDYIKQNNITENNINKFTYEKKSNKLIYYIKHIKYKLYQDKIEYIVKCNLFDNLEQEIYLIIIIDNNNSSFAILPQIEKYNDINEIKLKENVKNIDKNTNNVVVYNSVSDEKMCEYLLDDYIKKALYFPNELYNCLEKEYKDKRFENYIDFQKYLSENREMLEMSEWDNLKKYSEFNTQEQYTQYIESLNSINLEKYLVENSNEGKKYVCVDKYNNYYIFNLKNLMEYTLTLDTYTIESEKFKTEYNNGGIQRKVQLNIDKFIKMLNNKDYKNAYKILDDGFKNNYFKTEEDFKNYMKNNLFEYNNVSYEEFSQEDEINIYKIIVSDKTLKNDKKIKMNIIMQLKDGTDFVMSFGGAN